MMELDAYLDERQALLEAQWPLPDRLLSKYVIESCYKYGAQKRVLLLREKATGLRVILKYASGIYAEPLRREYALMRQLNSSSFPRAVDLFDEHGTTYMLRFFVQGTTLADLVASRTLSIKEIYHIVDQLCMIVEQLHAQQPPVIHRDLTARNLVQTPDMSWVLVDLDTIRYGDAEKGMDTQLLGTVGFAAPEQYGAQPSDVRTDVHGLGMLLAFMISGTYAPRNLGRAPKRMQRIVHHCVSFDPKHRYPTVHDLRTRLAWAAKPVLPVMACTVMLALLSVWLYWGMHRGDSSAIYPFVDSTIAHAISVQLNKPVSSIRTADLEGIDRLLLVGQRSFSQWDQVEAYGRDNVLTEDGMPTSSGQVRDLSDLRAMPNLRQLALYNQRVTKVDALTGLSALTHLSLSNNPVLDLSPIAHMSMLEILDITATSVDSADIIATLPALRELRTNDSLITDLSPITSLPLRILCIGQQNLRDNPSALTQFYDLEELWVQNPNKQSLMDLATLPRLSTLCMCPYPVENLMALANAKSLRILNIMGPFIKTFRGIERIPNLYSMSIEAIDGADMSDFALTNTIVELDVSKSGLSDLTFLLAVDSLERLKITSAQQACLPALADHVSVEVEQ